MTNQDHEELIEAIQAGTEREWVDRFVMHLTGELEFERKRCADLARQLDDLKNWR